MTTAKLLGSMKLNLTDTVVFAGRDSKRVTLWSKARKLFHKTIPSIAQDRKGVWTTQVNKISWDW